MTLPRGTTQRWVSREVISSTSGPATPARQAIAPYCMILCALTLRQPEGAGCVPSAAQHRSAIGVQRGAAAFGDLSLAVDDDWRGKAGNGAVELQPDAVHPTAVGQVAIADRAARVLHAPVAPSEIAGVPERLRAHR